MPSYLLIKKKKKKKKVHLNRQKPNPRYPGAANSDAKSTLKHEQQKRHTALGKNGLNLDPNGDSPWNTRRGTKLQVCE